MIRRRDHHELIHIGRSPTGILDGIPGDESSHGMSNDRDPQSWIRSLQLVELLRQRHSGFWQTLVVGISKHGTWQAGRSSVLHQRFQVFRSRIQSVQEDHQPIAWSNSVLQCQPIIGAWTRREMPLDTVTTFCLGGIARFLRETKRHPEPGALAPARSAIGRPRVAQAQEHQTNGEERRFPNHIQRGIVGVAVRDC